jgi:hypothetical protein
MRPSSGKLPMLAFLVGFAFLIATLVAHANGRTLVFVNGYELTPEELYSVQLQSGSRIPPGNYIYDGRTGCWAELNSGRSDCPSYAAGGSYGSRYGSGEWNGNGDWNHWSNAAGGAIGGTGDGCMYTTFGWSNC